MDTLTLSAADGSLIAYIRTQTSRSVQDHETRQSSCMIALECEGMFHLSAAALLKALSQLGLPLGVHLSQVRPRLPQIQLSPHIVVLVLGLKVSWASSFIRASSRICSCTSQQCCLKWFAGRFCE